MLMKWSEVKVVQSYSTLCNPMDYTVHGILQARILEWVAVPFSRASSQPRDWTQVSHIVGGFFTNWATREAQEYSILLPGIFRTQEWNRGLLHCRQILYQLSYNKAAQFILFTIFMIYLFPFFLLVHIFVITFKVGFLKIIGLSFLFYLRSSVFGV